MHPQTRLVPGAVRVHRFVWPPMPVDAAPAELSASPAVLSVAALSERLSQLQAALQSQQLADADAALRDLVGQPALSPGALDGPLRLVAQWHLESSRWADATDAFDRLRQANDTDQRQRTLARNLTVLQEHRPALLEELTQHRAANPDQPYRFVRAASGRVLMVQPTDEGTFTPVPPADRFGDFIKQTRASTEGKPEYPLALLGIGDGYALTLLAKHPPTLYMDQTLTVHVIEVDLDRLWMALHLHDWTDDELPDGGPLRDPRFVWHVGQRWDEHFRGAWEDDPWTPPPTIAVCPDPSRAPALGERLRAVSAEKEAQTAAALSAMKAKYAARPTRDWVDVLSENPPRPPRVAVMTSRFTTVLQYAARDTADALERLGCEVRFLIEDHRHQRFNAAVFTQLLEDFEPDLLLSIDATRHQLRGWVPDELPHLCWVQDALPQLMNEQLGRAITTRDFVLTFFAPRLVHDHNYPARQCVDMPMMVTTPRAGGTGCPQRERTGPDLLYASNVSGTAEQLAEQSVRRAPEALRPRVLDAAALVIAHYEDESSLPTEPDLDALLDDAVQAGRLREHDTSTRRALRDALWNPLNTGLYRQQALRWVADVAEERGLTLHVHGRGWDQHPRFAAYDHGPLDHGGLSAATAAARFALHLEPYICFTHHRMLDALQAGTCVLIRDHPGHFGLQEVAAFLHERCPEATSDAQARDACGDDTTRAQLDALLRRYRGLTWDLAGDVVAQVRCWQRAGVLPDESGATPALPRLDEVTFTDRGSFASCVDVLSSGPDRVEALVAAQRRAVNERLTFDAAFARVLRRIRELLAEEPT